MSVVLVTGSSTGIGLATALHFGRLGDGVYARVRNIATASELTKARRRSSATSSATTPTGWSRAGAS